LYWPHDQVIYALELGRLVNSSVHADSSYISTKEMLLSCMLVGIK
jgi:hypothetical protein